VHRGERYQVRFLRGTKERLKQGWINLPDNANCVAIPAYVFVPDGIDNGIIDLGYPQIKGWVEESTSETYVLVLEQIDTPDLRHTVRLKPSFAPTYIDRGLQVVLQAPPRTPPSQPSAVSRFLGRIFGGMFAAIFPSANASTMTAPAPSAPPPPSPPKREPAMDCLQFP